MTLATWFSLLVGVTVVAIAAGFVVLPVAVLCGGVGALVAAGVMDARDRKVHYSQRLGRRRWPRR